MKNFKPILMALSIAVSYNMYANDNKVNIKKEKEQK